MFLPLKRFDSLRLSILDCSGSNLICQYLKWIRKKATNFKMSGIEYGDKILSNLNKTLEMALKYGEAGSYFSFNTIQLHTIFYLMPFNLIWYSCRRRKYWHVQGNGEDSVQNRTWFSTWPRYNSRSGSTELDWNIRSGWCQFAANRLPSFTWFSHLIPGARRKS